MKATVSLNRILATLLIWAGSAGAQQPPAQALPPGMPDLSKARPAIHAFSAAEIDRISGASGLTDCFWVGTLSPTTFNILIPDTSLVYWITQFRLPVGARLEFKGQYPHGRYLSFNSYNPTGQPVDALNDQQIAPDAGSQNPFLPGAQRQVAKRDYTVRIEPRAMQAGVRVDPATRPGNTLFVPTDDTLYQVWMRVYVPDTGRDARGGVPLPSPVLTLADGKRLEGAALCSEIVVKEGAVKDFKATPEGLRHVFAVPGARAPHHPAQPAPVPWNAFFNPQLTMTNALINTPYEAVRARIDATRRAGFYSTLDNVYMSTYVDNRYGDALVMRGKAPRAPRTLKGAAVMDADVDLRYWSVCKYRSVADGAVDSCLYDEQVPLDAQGRYTIVVSTPAARPSNARADCGVAWMDWGVGDGIGNPHGGFVAMRHMLPHPNFANSLWATQKPGDEERALGDYYPATTYDSKAAFEARGCPVK
ncbi:MAG: hypothetical protein NTV11_14580 [Rhodocyclales bacterium]|nr:hypothetical protein [Rhodocyclales bacterium]